MHNVKHQESWLVFLRTGDFDRDSNHDADCDIGDLGQTNGDNNDGDDDQNGKQSVKEEYLVISSIRAFQWTLYNTRFLRETSL